MLILSVFLLASVAFAIDFGNLWFRRQAVQKAADAACEAGAMDMLYAAQGTSLPNMGFTPGVAGNCGSSSSATICTYAKFNGLTASSGGFSSTAESVGVSWSFPASTSVSGVSAPSGVSYPFLKVLIEE
ncbi:MAG: pilus assembly protein TadG-related protein, partial [Gemmataceae bacterium]